MYVKLIVNLLLIISLIQKVFLHTGFLISRLWVSYSFLNFFFSLGVRIVHVFSYFIPLYGLSSMDNVNFQCVLLYFRVLKYKFYSKLFFIKINYIFEKMWILINYNVKYFMI